MLIARPLLDATNQPVAIPSPVATSLGERRRGLERQHGHALAVTQRDRVEVLDKRDAALNFEEGTGAQTVLAASDEVAKIHPCADPLHL
jgi:hypothetical protein